MEPQAEDKFHTRIWKEIPEADDPFSAAICYCYGYDVYGEVLRKASWAEYLYLLFQGERPSSRQASLLEALAIALANPGIREPSVHAAMSGGAGGSASAACLMASLAVGAGQLAGARELYHSMHFWLRCGRELSLWQELLTTTEELKRVDVWPTQEHVPGFNPHGVSCPRPLQQILTYLSECSPGEHLLWLEKNRLALEQITNRPVALANIAAAAFVDLNMNPNQGEMLYLLLRLPGAAAHALEQKELGWRRFPLFRRAINLIDDPMAPSTHD